jgi:lysophospholipase L1-like esterase
LGDSIIDGVGAKQMSRSMAVTAAREVAATTGRRVEFEIVGLSGATSTSIRSELLPQVVGSGFDFVVVSAGVNDVTGRTRTSGWRREMCALIDELTRDSPDAHVLTCGLPPLGRFPLLPAPLRSFIGVRARTLDRILAEVASQREQVTWLPTDFDASPEKFAADGYHPNSESHEEWGRRVGEALLARR